MEINNINSLNNVSNLNDNNSLNKLSNDLIVSNSDEQNNSYSINQDITPKRSNLSMVLNQFIPLITQNQTDLSNLNKQNNILDSMSNVVNNIEGKSTNSKINHESHIKELAQNYNKVEAQIKLVNDLNEEGDSHSYFDGAFGSSPLNVNDMLNQVNQKQEITKNRIEIINNNIDEIKSNVNNQIENEVTKTNQSMPFKNIDFGKHTSDFSSANINNIIGSVVLSQANAIPSNSPRLLA